MKHKIAILFMALSIAISLAACQNKTNTITAEQVRKIEELEELVDNQSKEIIDLNSELVDCYKQLSEFSNKIEYLHGFEYESESWSKERFQLIQANRELLERLYGKTELPPKVTKEHYDLVVECPDSKYGIYDDNNNNEIIENLYLYDSKSDDFRETPIETSLSSSIIFGYNNEIITAYAGEIKVYDPVTLEITNKPFSFQFKTNKENGEMTIINGLCYDTTTECYIFSYIEFNYNEYQENIEDFRTPLKLRIFDLQGQLINELDADIMVCPATKYQWNIYHLQPLENKHVRISGYAGTLLPLMIVKYL